MGKQLQTLGNTCNLYIYMWIGARAQYCSSADTVNRQFYVKHIEHRRVDRGTYSVQQVHVVRQATVPQKQKKTSKRLVTQDNVSIAQAPLPNST